MVIVRRALAPLEMLPTNQLKKNCLGCEDCSGTCIEAIQMHLPLETLIEAREKRA